MSSFGYEPPARRGIRVFNLDPMKRDSVPVSTMLSVPWEPLRPGPVGDRLEVVDFDAVNRCYYEPVDLDNPLVAAQGGLSPDERDPRMHQQMTYAVAARVLEVFDRALGRRVSFRSKRLRLFPHAFYGANAFYQHDIDAVLFGFFHATDRDDGIIDGQPVFSCLSHDIVAHEVTHALTYRLRPHYQQRSNPDVKAWCEAIADLVALLLHFQLEGVLESVVDGHEGRLDDPSPLVELAGQYGRSMPQRMALRSALVDPTPTTSSETEPYRRASRLVAAVFSGFVSTFEEETRNLVLLATNGSGRLPPGAVPPPLVRAVCESARHLSDRLLSACIRSFDYLPPADVTFGDFVRAVVTADADLFPSGNSTLRQRLVEGFHRYGINAAGVWSLSESALRLEKIRELTGMPVDADLVLSACTELRPLWTDATIASEQESRWQSHGPAWARDLKNWAKSHDRVLGLRPDLKIDARHFHTSVRFDEDGQPRVDIVVQFVQSTMWSIAEGKPPLQVWGGTTVISDASGQVRYIVKKQIPLDIDQPEMYNAMIQHLSDADLVSSLQGLDRDKTRIAMEAFNHGY